LWQYGRLSWRQLGFLYVNVKLLILIGAESSWVIMKYVSNVCSAGFYRLRQLRRVRRSLDTESSATLVHAFVTSRIDYCNVLLAGAPRATTDKLQRLLNAAARLLSGTKKFDRGLSQLMHVDLHRCSGASKVQTRDDGV